jgi:hypothetical protein
MNASNILKNANAKYVFNLLNVLFSSTDPSLTVQQAIHMFFFIDDNN